MPFNAEKEASCQGRWRDRPCWTPVEREPRCRQKNPKESWAVTEASLFPMREKACDKG